MTSPRSSSPRGHDADRLMIVFGDQLDIRSPALKELDRERDVVVMIEADEEARHVRSHKQRIALFLAAMRHFAETLRERDYRVHYVMLDDDENTHSFEGEIERAVRRFSPRSIRAVRPGEWRVLRTLEQCAEDLGVEFELVEDPHFYLAPDAFAEWANGRKELILEHFYRRMRKHLGVLVDDAGKPEGGTWNFDQDNRQAFRGSTDSIPSPPNARTDEMTQSVLDLVRERFPDAPGGLDSFAWPVTRRQALYAMRQFIEQRLPNFGAYQDAMVSGQPSMYHSLLSSSLNLKLLDPRECVDAAVGAYRNGDAPLNSVEGFVRQLIGWREFIRGVYWLEGPEYGERNALDQHGELPDLYWSGETDMNCMRQCIGEVLENGYGHHIQRLMVTGNFALIAGVHPRAISDWYLAMYVDAVDWVTLPNTLGMAMHADGGIVGTKPYCASGRYVQRMSDYCDACRYDPAKRTGDDACPFTTFYWDFLIRNHKRFKDNRRMTFPMKNLETIAANERKRIKQCAVQLRIDLGVTRKKAAAS